MERLPRLHRALPEMRALDEQPWDAGMAVTSFGVRIGLRVDDREMLPFVEDRLPPQFLPSDHAVVDHLYSVRTGGAAHGAAEPPFYRVNRNDELIVATADRELALAALESGLRVSVAADANDWVFVHAGAVGWRGRALVIPAPSTHGKSTLVEALVRAGAVYYSDEFAVLDRRGLMHPFAKPLSLRPASGPARRVNAFELGGVVGETPLPIGVVVATQYQRGASWHPRVGSMGEALCALLSNTVGARRAPSDTLKILTRAVAKCTLMDGPRGEATAVADALLQAVDRGLTEVARR